MVRNWRPTSNFALPPELAFPAFGKFMDVLFEPPTRVSRPLVHPTFCATGAEGADSTERKGTSVIVAFCMIPVGGLLTANKCSLSRRI